MFRIFDFAGPAAVLDPAPRMVRADVLQTGSCSWPGALSAVRGIARRKWKDSCSPERVPKLAAHGVGWVLVETALPADRGESQRTWPRSSGVRDDDLSSTAWTA